MASIPNRVYPQNEFNEIDTIVTKHYVFGGKEVWHGFTSSGSIGLYQPVGFCYNATSGVYCIFGLTGSASGLNQCHPIGVADTSVTTGQKLGIIVRGPVTMLSSGASVSGVGARVAPVWSGSATGTYVADYNPTSVTAASGSIGIVIATGSDIPNVTLTVFVMPF